MDQNSRTDIGTTPTGASGTTGGINNAGVTSSSETCAHCGAPLSGGQGLEQFLSRIGITEEMINNLKSSMQNVDVEEYLNTAREYLKNAGDKLKTGSDKATTYAKDNPGKVAAGVAVLAVGAGLLLSSIGRDRS
ncbi:MAG TPA: hypothetical protein VMS98_00030 [Thermoanaerobaculia bacterium]|nr:hypothetical protein [Thermoanaerobaculia bacterium]